MKSLVTFSIIGAAALAAVLLLTIALSQPQASATIDGNHFALAGADHAYQVDIAGPYKPFGLPGHFKLLGDFTPNAIVAGHVALSNINCKADGTSPFVLLLANAQVGAGNSQVQIVSLNSTNMINDVSSAGFFCTYHVDIHSPGVNATGGIFPITDLAIVNTNKGATVTPHPTASATIHVQDCEFGGISDTIDSLPFCGFIRTVETVS
ncbi:MAG TPA: hypothetical protein VJZ68_01495 [Nitrososphaera sp.]|nr:hypothetical protein [Nitrososphaera sp.]